MHLILKKRDWLQLMADGAEGAEGAVTGDDNLDAAGDNSAPAEDLEAEFDKLVKGDGKFRQIFGKRTQKAVLERTKGMKAAVDRLNNMGPALEVLAARYGTTPDDDRLIEMISQDQSLLEDMALRNGRDTETEMELARARAQSQRAEELIQKMLAEQDMRKWEMQAEEMAAEYPDFNLQMELMDPRFQDLLRNNIDVKGAYMALHPDAVIQHTVRTATKKVTDTVAANKQRPRENGTGAQATGAIGVNPAALTREQTLDYMRRVARGERVDFTTG